jgi:predicted short-subunit dehydrogenase-like oxidoreductase (DUF2520 family)
VSGISQTVICPIAILGTGRMAKALGALLSPVSAVAGRSRSSAENATNFIGSYQLAAPQAICVNELPGHSRHILIAVPDDAIAEVAAELVAAGLNRAIVLHTSGAAGLEALGVLRAAGNSIGVLHPMQTVPSAERGVETLPGATYAFAGDPQAAEWARSLIGHLGGKPLAIDPQRWHHYHAAAVMACNYQVTIMDAALELMEIAGVARAAALDALAPIVRATTENVLLTGPEQALTGPISRGDAGTVRGHLTALQVSSPETRQLYIAAGLRTVTLAERAGLTANVARALRHALCAQE